MSYVGRFAPSPTGPLHFGSLVTAVVSYLHARQAGGEWLVRIEDIDPPREIPGAADRILRTLEACELEWDRSVLYQSSRLDAYRDAAGALLAAGRAFRCRCSRSEIRAANEGESGRYPGTCRARRAPTGDAAVRALVEPGFVTVEDGLQGTLRVDLAASLGDYVIVRRDQLPAYHLAVVVDDAAQGVTTIVRGIDLLEPTAAHVHLQAALGLATPEYYHVPVIVNERHQKLSKQTHAAAIDGHEKGLARRILQRLGLEVPQTLEHEPPSAHWKWALERWQLASLRGQRELLELRD